MQINREVRDNHLIFKKIKDGTSYLILFLASLLFIELGISLFVIPLRVLKNRIPFNSVYAINNVLSLSSIVVQVIAYIFFICAVCVICNKVLVTEFNNFKLKLGRNIGLIFAFGVGIYVVDVIVGYIYAKLGETGTSMNQLMIYGALSSPVKWPTILLVVILAPIVEELIYRKFMIGTLHQKLKLPLWGAGLLSAAIFALIHVSSSIDQLIYFPQYFALAFVLVAAYIYSGQNIYFSIGVHIFNNTVSIFIWAISTWIQ